MNLPANLLNLMLQQASSLQHMQQHTTQPTARNTTPSRHSMALLKPVRSVQNAFKGTRRVKIRLYVQNAVATTRFVFLAAATATWRSY